jgi:hypothetical protein
VAIVSQTASQNEVPIMMFLFSHRTRQKGLAGPRPRFVPQLEPLEDRTVLSTLTVTSAADDGSAGTLRAVVASANAGDTIKFATKLKGDTITLTQGQLAITKNLAIEGLGVENLAISGNNASRIFDISSGVSLILARLTLSNGLADHGGAILDETGASLTLSHDVLANNQATGGVGGGAIFNDTGASLNIRDSVLADNQATTAVNFDPSTGGGGGGAIFNNFGASLSVTNCGLSSNQAITTAGFDNFGGAIYNLGGSATLMDCTLSNNQASGGGSSPFSGGSFGGAVADALGATLTVAGSRFINNRAISADGGYFAMGGALDNELSTATISNSRFTDNQAIGSGGGAVSGGFGGAIESGLLTGLTQLLPPFANRNVSYSTFTGNRAMGGSSGGVGTGGGIDMFGAGIIGHSTFTGNQAIGGDGGVITDLDPFIGIGLGGGVSTEGPDTTGAYTIDQCTFTNNESHGGKGGSGGSGTSATLFYSIDDADAGGMIVGGGTAVVSRCTFSYNQAIGGSNATGGTNVQQSFVGNALGGAMDILAPGSVAMVTNSTFDHNEARGGNDDTGTSGNIATGMGIGGGISNTVGGTLIASGLTISHNQAVGGTGDTGGLFVGVGLGGGLGNIYQSTSSISNSTIDHNQAIGGQVGATATGGDGLGGGVANTLGSAFTLSNCRVDQNRAIGGEGEDGGNGGNGLGRGVYNDGTTDFGISSLTVLASTMNYSNAKGGTGDDGGSDGLGVGGGVYLVAGSLARKDASTIIAHNHAAVVGKYWILIEDRRIEKHPAVQRQVAMRTDGRPARQERREVAFRRQIQRPDRPIHDAEARQHGEEAVVELGGGVDIAGSELPHVLPEEGANRRVGLLDGPPELLPQADEAEQADEHGGADALGRRARVGISGKPDCRNWNSSRHRDRSR